jgi:hypothetical protein
MSETYEEKTMPIDQERAESTVRNAFGAFRQVAMQQACVATIALVRAGDFEAALDRLQEILTKPAGAPPRHLDFRAGDALPDRVGTALEEVEATRGPGLPPATDAELTELRSAALALAHAYAIQGGPGVPGAHAAFDATIDRIRQAVLARACAAVDRQEVIA